MNTPKPLNPDALPKSAKCAECGGAITWERFQNGEAVPVDLEPSKEGTIEIHKGRAHIVKAGTLSFHDRFCSHLETCLAKKGPRAS